MHSQWNNMYTYLIAALLALVFLMSSDAKATGQRIRLMNLADMATVVTEKNPGARPGFEFIARGNYPAGGRYPASTI